MAIEYTLGIPKSSWTEASTSDDLESYTGQFLWGGILLPSAERQSMYFTALLAWEEKGQRCQDKRLKIRGSFNKRCRRWKGEILFTVSPFSWISFMRYPFMSENTVRIIFCFECCVWKFFFTRKSVFSFRLKLFGTNTCLAHS